LRWGPTPSAYQRSLPRSRRLIATPFHLVRTRQLPAAISQQPTANRRRR